MNTNITSPTIDINTAGLPQSERSGIPTSENILPITANASPIFGILKKTHAKFEIVQEILPHMAKKAADHLGRPVPNLDRTITRIMNVVWIEPSVSNDKKKDRRTITYTVYNYTSTVRTFRLHAHLPKECIKDLTLFSSPFFLDVNDEGKANWEIRDIQPSTNVTVTFDLAGDMADTFDADDIYFSGLNPVMVMGAEMLPGDWGIKGMEIVESAEDYVEEEDEKEEEEEDLDDE